MKAEELKFTVREKYAEIAKKSLIRVQYSCCGNSDCCDESDFSMIGDEYTGVEGHEADADLGLGCGIPTQFAEIKVGDSVLDLGSGAGNDCFVARAIVGETGKITGIDFTDEMLEKARSNNAKLGYTNVEFIKGDIEAMPLADNMFDVVVSNCVLNLVPDKQKAFSEMYRVLKSGGHFCVSDVVIKGELPEKLQKDAEMYAGCVSGASNIDSYLETIRNQGFKDIVIHKEKVISIPENVLERYLSKEEILSFTTGNTGIISITVSAKK